MNLDFRTLYADEIECRVATVSEKGVSLLLYKDARVDQRLLDETVGALNWQRHHSRDNANCTVAIWDDTKNQWIEKEDTGKESFSEAEKGLASDSFKRACFNWGIGRELYTAPFIWLTPEVVEIKEGKADSKGNKKLTTYDRFEVSAIGYDEEKNINSLTIRNSKTKKVVYSYGSGAPKQEPPKPTAAPKQAAAPQTTQEMTEEQMKAIGKQKIDATKIAALSKACAAHGVPSEKIFKLYKVASFAELSENQYSNINNNWENIKKL